MPAVVSQSMVPRPSAHFPTHFETTHFKWHRTHRACSVTFLLVACYRNIGQNVQGVVNLAHMLGHSAQVGSACLLLNQNLVAVGPCNKFNFLGGLMEIPFIPMVQNAAWRLRLESSRTPPAPSEQHQSRVDPPRCLGHQDPNIQLCQTQPNNHFNSTEDETCRN